jgi:predicted O-linked N-acetylglucosamine transferase (SPINDLY family)
VTPNPPPQAANDLRRRLVTALTHHQRGELKLAREQYQAILTADPRCFDALHLLGMVTADLGGLDEGISLVRRATSLDRSQGHAHLNLATLLLRRGDSAAALESLDEAIELMPGNADAWFMRGNLLHEQNRLAEAISNYERALGLRPEFPQALNNAAVALRSLRRLDRALDFIDRALALRPTYAEALNNRGLILVDANRRAAAIDSFRKALELSPHFTKALHNLGSALTQSKRFAAARDMFEQLNAVAPRFPHALGNLLHAGLNCCDWSAYGRSTAALTTAVERDEPADLPLQFLHVSGSAALQLRCARAFTAAHYGAATAELPRYESRPVRIAYLSGDLGEHAITYLLTGVFERHDRTRFETYAVSWGRQGQGPRRKRIEEAFDRFIDITGVSDEEAVRLIRGLRVDILVDLAGHTWGQRTMILAHRAAPVQVNFLGFPGTMGASYMDYLIADRFVVPPERRGDYAEQIVWLPETFQPNDDRRKFGGSPGTRQTHGLPAGAFVFCSFNSTAKFNPLTFDVWMRLLDAVKGSVLWLLAPQGEAQDNLRREAGARGIDPSRLLFADVIPYEAYLARYVHADLFLDTFPFNGGATVSDALSAGLPVLTWSGDSFASRMAGSLLTSLGFTELVAFSLEDYEQKARDLSARREHLDSLRRRLLASRDRHPVFDSNRYCRHLEAAYLAMRDRSAAGASPSAIEVPLCSPGNDTTVTTEG